MKAFSLCVLFGVLAVAGCVPRSDYELLIAKEAESAKTISSQQQEIQKLTAKVASLQDIQNSPAEHQYAAIVIGIMNNNWTFAGPACQNFLKNFPESELAPAVRIHLQEATKKLGDIDAYKKEIEEKAKKDEELHPKWSPEPKPKSIREAVSMGRLMTGMTKYDASQSKGMPDHRWEGREVTANERRAGVTELWAYEEDDGTMTYIGFGYGGAAVLVQEHLRGN